LSVALGPEAAARYSRHLLLAEVGAAGQARLAAARVLIVGAGGLGSPAALYLAAAGVGTLGLVDDDRVELSNLQRQVLYATADVGAPKPLAAKRRLDALNPGIMVVAHPLELCAANAESLIAGYDVVLDGSDRVATRYLVNDACVRTGRALVSASIHRFEGQAITILPGRGPCYRCLFPSAPAEGAESCAEAGVLGVLPGVLGTIQATEAIKVLLGIGEPLVGRLLTYDALALEFACFPVERRPDCAICGARPTITVLVDAPRHCAAGEGVTSLAPGELARRIGSTAPPRIVDVREPHEFAAGHLVGAQSMPLARLEQGLAALDAGEEIVFVCRSGLRSARAAAEARRRGHARVANLEGGLLAWAATVDPALIVSG
jgi:adenylyltransferase/sulfurtransferase